MGTESRDINNLKIFNRDDVVDYYHKLRELQACEDYVFAKYIRPGMRILDLGVGAGRTVPCLSGEAKAYIGVDYSEQMIAACRSRFPGTDFRVLDASIMPSLLDNSFDVVVFAFNGIDYLWPDEKRRQCLQECHRLLAERGFLIFSRHNARRILVRPQVRGAGPIKAVWRIVRAIFRSVHLASRHVRDAAFWSGQGYIRDPVHGGLNTHQATPKLVIEESSRKGLRVVEVINGNYPTRGNSYATPWYYYVFTKQ